jgi:hypothetical protein
MYFEIQRVAAVVRRAAEAHSRGGAAAAESAVWRAELGQALAELRADAIPPSLRSPLAAGTVLGPDAAYWAREVLDWLASECRRDTLL